MTFSHDVAYATRLLRRSPAFTLTAVLSLAIGIAANGAIFSLADAVLLRDRPGIDEEGLVDIARSQDGEGFDNNSYPNFADLRERSRSFSGIAGFRFSPEPVGLATAGGARRVWGQPVSANYFDVLGVAMARGRGFVEEEDRAGAPRPVAVIGHRLWRTEFGAAADAVGATIRVNGVVFTIVGVAPEGFAGNSIGATELWVPLTMYPAMFGRDPGLLANRAAVWIMAVGRLKPGVTIEQARAEVAAIGRTLAREHPVVNEGRGIAAQPSHRLGGFARSYVAAFIGLLFALVGLVLLIACTNVAGMLLARGVARGREVALRLAVGAKRGRIVRQLVTESVMLSLGGALAGVAAALWMIGALRAFLPALPVDVAIDLRLDWRVIGFSTLLAVTTGVLFGLVPALQAARTDLAAALKDGAAGHAPRRARLRHGFVVAQVAMSVLLVVCALLFARSLREAGRIDPGFDAAHVDSASIDFRLAGYDAARGARVSADVLDRVRRLPGVESAAYAAVAPLTGSGLGLGALTLPGQAADARDRVRPDWNVVTPGYFETLRTRIVAGRAFTEADRGGATDVAIVNQAFARRAWPGADPIGQVLHQHETQGAPPRVLTVVGVAQDAKYRSIGEEPRAFIYVPHAQQYRAETYLLARTDGRRSALPGIAAAVRQIDPNLPITHAAPLAELTSLGLLPHRLAAWVAGAFGAVGLLLASIGIYGITAFNVTQRTREIGVRVALGAARADVLRLVVGQAMRMAIAGAAGGLLLAAAATQLLRGLLYGVTPLDPVSFGAGAGLFAGLALAASWLPARRAASVNPVEALRTE